MPSIRLGLAQCNYTVGDITGNVAMVREQTRRAADARAGLVVFPELTVTGYMPEDLVLRASFRQASRAALEGLATDLDSAGLGELAVVLGYVDDDTPSDTPSDTPDGGGPRNALAFVHRGAVVAHYFKVHLPNYGVFDERRYFVSGSRFVIVRHLGVDIALTVCEDLWEDGGPFATAGALGVGLVVNINGSPYERNKDEARLPLLRRRAAEAGAPVVYVNTVGGQDELVFDGDSMIVTPTGEVLLRAPHYDEGLYLADIDVEAGGRPQPQAPSMSVHRFDTGVGAVPAVQPPVQAPVADPLEDEAEVWGALVIGLRDYVGKNGFASVVLGMSGGIDSAVVATLAADAIGGANVCGVSMPSSHSSGHSRSDAAELAERIGADYRVVPIAQMVEAFVDSLGLTGIAEENVQARVRGVTLMAISNAEGHLTLATGNKSELAVGYSTIYGDAVGGFAPIKDVPKTLVWTLARWRNAWALEHQQRPPIPQNSIDKPASAELRPGQVDADSLPDYQVLDEIIARYVDGDRSVAEIVPEGFDEQLVTDTARMIDRAEWKRRQYPPGTKISFKSFGKDRRLPITNRWRDTAQ